MGWKDAPVVGGEKKPAWAPAVAAPAKPPAMDAPSSGVGMGLRDPVDALAQVARRIVPEGIGRAVDTFGNWLADKGLPVTRSEGVEGVDNVVKGVNKAYEQNRRDESADPGFDWARLGGNLVNPVNYAGGGMLKGASTVGALAKAGAVTGAASGVLQPVLNTEDFWTEKGKQGAMGAASGAVMAPVLSKVAEATAKGAQRVITKVRPAPDARTINVAVNNTFLNQGVNPADVPQVIQDSVRRQVDEAMRAGVKMDPAAMIRRAEFEAVRLTDDAAPTLGQMTRDPMQFANEKNLSGVRIRTPQGEGNPLADRFQTQNNRLGEVFDGMGAREATDRVTAGQTLMDSLRAADAPVKQGVDAAYDAARAMTGGRAADLERGVFSQNANRALDEGMWGRFVPPEIRGLLNDITENKTPFNVDAAVQIDGILSKAQRKARRAGDDAGEAAIGVIRDALHVTPLSRTQGAAATAGATRAMDDGVTDAAFREVNPARAAFDEARRAARSRFATIEETPALKAALDDAAPDKFVQQYILNANVRDLQAMRQVLQNSPEALGQARAQIAEHLKNAAFGPNPSGDKAFAADRYMRTLHGLGGQRLGVFFSPEEIMRLNLVGKVASDINSIPAGAKYGTNTSGSASAVMNLLSKLTESPIMRQVPGMRMIANQVGEIQTERAMNQALTPKAPNVPSELSPEAVRALQFLLTPAGVTGGVLGGSAVN